MIAHFNFKTSGITGAFAFCRWGVGGVVSLQYGESLINGMAAIVL